MIRIDAHNISIKSRLGLLTWIRTILPDASIDTDNDGQLVVYTNVVEIDGEVFSMDDPTVSGFDVVKTEDIAPL